MMRNIYSARLARLMVAAFSLSLAQSAAAYIGPGAGLSLVGALWGLLMAVGAALAFIVMWPLRKAFRRRGKARQAAENTRREPATAEPGHEHATADGAPRAPTSDDS